MYRLLVVDDEVAVVNGLVYDIDWTQLNISEVFKAYNGVQALECIRKNRIDVVIADIAMPEMDGLEIVRRVRAQWPHIKTVLLTGYSEFKYAQNAIDLKVSSYITKPAADDEIISSVRNAINEIEQEMKQKDILLQAEKQFKSLIPILQEKYMNSWVVQGHSNPDNEPEKWKSCELGLKPQCAGFLILIRVDETENGAGTQNARLYKTALRDFAKSLLLRGHTPMFFEDDEENLVILVQWESDIEEHLRYAEEMSEFFQETVKKALGCIISVFISDAARSLNRFHDTYRRMLQAMRTNMTLGSGIVIAVHENRDFSDQKRILSLDTNTFFPFYLERLQKEEAIEWVTRVFNELKETKIASYIAVLQIYHHISLALINFSIREGIEYEDWLEKGAEYLENFYKMKSLETLKAWSLQSTAILIDLACEKKNKNSGSLVENAKLIINDRLEDNLTISELAACLFVNSSYLSRLFKKQTGIAIVDYLIQLKIERAKKLLEQRNYKVHEVAHILGYESAAHFSRIFKRETGVSPKDYSDGKRG